MTSTVIVQLPVVHGASCLFSQLPLRVGVLSPHSSQGKISIYWPTSFHSLLCQWRDGLQSPLGAAYGSRKSLKLPLAPLTRQLTWSNFSCNYNWLCWIEFGHLWLRAIRTSFYIQVFILVLICFVNNKMSFVPAFHKGELRWVCPRPYSEKQSYIAFFFFPQQIVSWPQIMGKHWITQIKFNTPCRLDTVYST